MKIILPKLLKCRLVQAGGLLAIIAAAAATIAWSSDSAQSFKLEGAWISQSAGDVRALLTQVPDASGHSAVFRGQMVWKPEALARLGLDAVTDEIAEAVATGPNTGKYSGIWYGLAGGRIVMIFLDNSTFTFDGPSSVVQHTIDVYLATTDADNDGFPDPGSTPVTTLLSTSNGKRVGH